MPIKGRVNHTAVYLERPFNLIGIAGEGLFEPERLGIHRRSIGGRRRFPRCFVGPPLWFYCQYAAVDDRLVLDEIHIALDKEDSALALRGALPGFLGLVPQVQTDAEGESRRWFLFEHLALPVPYRGGMLLGTEWDRELTEYKEVRELVFDEGRLTDYLDRSNEAALAARREAALMAHWDELLTAGVVPEEEPDFWWNEEQDMKEAYAEQPGIGLRDAFKWDFSHNPVRRAGSCPLQKYSLGWRVSDYGVVYEDPDRYDDEDLDRYDQPTSTGVELADIVCYPFRQIFTCIRMGADVAGAKLKTWARTRRNPSVTRRS